MKENTGFDEVEAVRKSLLKDHSPVWGKDLGAGSRAAKSSDGKTIASIARYGISSRKDCRFLSAIVKSIQPETCIELGTSLGISSAYLAKSRDGMQLFTFEGNAKLIEKARGAIDQLGCENVQVIHGNIDEELPEQLNKMTDVDLALIDANHTGKALLRYFKLLKTKMNPAGAILVDDIRWSIDMYRGWKKLVSDKSVSLSIEFLNNGILFFGTGVQKQHYILSY